MQGLMRRILVLFAGLWLAAAAPAVIAAEMDHPGAKRLPPVFSPATPARPALTVAPAQAPVMALPDLDEYRTIIIVAAGGVLIIAVVAILFVLLRLRRARQEQPGEADYEPRAYLNDLQGVTPLASYELGLRPTMLGRVTGPENSQLDYIVIPEFTVGRRHALIEYKDYAYWISDQGSINGTFVNNKMVTSERRLKHGDRIKLHRYEFEFILPELLGTGMTVVSETVYKKNAGKSRDEKPQSAAGIQLTEEDFDATGDEDATSQPGIDAVKARKPSAAPDAEDGSDTTLAPGLPPDNDDATLQRYIDTGAYRTPDPDDDDMDDDDEGKRD